MQQPDMREQAVAIDIAFYDRYAPTILAYLCRHIFNPHDAEDMLLEVFLAALKRPGFTELAAEHQLAWLRRVAHNKMIDRLRRRGRLTLVSLEEALEYESGAPTPEQQSMCQESYALLYRLVARLSPDQQELIQLRYGEGLRIVEIAARLRKPDTNRAQTDSTHAESSTCPV